MLIGRITFFTGMLKKLKVIMSVFKKCFLGIFAGYSSPMRTCKVNEHVSICIIYSLIVSKRGPKKTR